MEFDHILRALFEISVLWVVFYQLYRAFKGSRSATILAGLIIAVLLGVVILQIAHASVLQHITSSIMAPGTIVIVLAILFQNELRTALAKLGTIPHVRRLEGNNNFLEELCGSVAYLVSKRYGALIVLWRQNNLAEQVATGTKLDAVYTRELIGSIFMPKTLLHDGAVIVRHERVVCAGAILPVSNRELKDPSMGLRHRAGIGMAETSDAVVIVVSEETGTVTLVVGSVLQRDLTLDLLRKRLEELLYV